MTTGLKKLFVLLFALLTALGPAVAQTRLLAEGFDPAKYPGRMPPEERKKLDGLAKQMQDAMNARDAAKLAKIRAEMIAGMGKWVGISENPPNYAKPDAAKPEFGKVENILIQSFERTKGRNGWEQAAAAYKAGESQPRLRISFRLARSYFHSFEAGLKDSQTFFKYAVDGSNYMVSEQTSSGAFGYPYDANAKDGLKATALRVVLEGEKRGIKMTEGKWIVDDLDGGDLQFDNGEVGFGLLHAYILTGDKKYLDSARRAGDWAAKRPLVKNFNYNGFSGCLLARLYRVTGEKKYLDAAKDKFVYGVMPGQMENGRWFDQHNAAIQYHALMMRQLIEFYLALRKAKDPLEEAVKKSIITGLDNMAEEDTTYGVTIGKAGESLGIEAYAFGSMLFGKRESWDRAADINIKFLTKEFLPEIEKRGFPFPETAASYLLYRRFADGKAISCEIELEKCLEKLKNRR